MKGNKFRRLTSVLLVAILALGAFFYMPQGAVEVQAAGDPEARNVNLCVNGKVSGISKPAVYDATQWNGSKVYFGQEAQLWRVLDPNAFLLFSDVSIGNKAFDADSKDWANSDIKNWLNGAQYKDNNAIFSPMERALIATNTDGDIRLLAYDEIFNDVTKQYNAEYGFLVGGDAQMFPAGSTDVVYWWLRSADSQWDVPDVVNTSGAPSHRYAGSGILNLPGEVTDELGICPVFNLNSEGIAFTTAVDFYKGTFASVGNDAVILNTWELTLKYTGAADFTHTALPAKIKAGEDSAFTVNTIDRGGDTFNQLSAMIIDEANTVVAYGKIGEATVGDKTFTVPADLKPGVYKVAVFPELISDERYKVDYALDPNFSEIIITGPAATPNATFSFDGNDANKLMNTTDTMRYSLDNGATWTDCTAPDTDLTAELAQITVENGILVQDKGNGTTLTPSAVQVINITKAAAPKDVKGVDCKTSSNNDGMLLAVTAAMEYRKEGEAAWKPGAGDNITGLTDGTYYVRVKASGTVMASDEQIVVINKYSSVSPASGKPKTGDSSNLVMWMGLLLLEIGGILRLRKRQTSI